MDIVKEFREWGPKQINSDGNKFKEKSISNYHSSLKTILGKLELQGMTDYKTVYDCKNIDEYKVLHELILEHINFVRINRESNHTHSSALNLYERFLIFLRSQEIPEISQKNLEALEEQNIEKARIISYDELKKGLRIKKEN